MSRPRTAGSVRFDTYWKVQYWDRYSLAWRDIQAAYPTREAATARAVREHIAAGREGSYRLMRISDDGTRRPEPMKITTIPMPAARTLSAGVACLECGENHPTVEEANTCARLDLDPRKEPHRK